MPLLKRPDGKCRTKIGSAHYRFDPAQDEAGQFKRTVSTDGKVKASMKLNETGPDVGADRAEARFCYDLEPKSSVTISARRNANLRVMRETKHADLNASRLG